MQQARTMDPKVRPIYEVVMEQVKHASLRDEGWMRGTTLEFVKKNIFVRTFQECRALYNQKKIEKR